TADGLRFDRAHIGQYQRGPAVQEQQYARPRRELGEHEPGRRRPPRGRQRRAVRARLLTRAGLPRRRGPRLGGCGQRGAVGLGGAVWSRDKEKALVVAKQMRTGTVWINEYHLLSVAAPFGGYKQSGIGREFGLEGILEYTEVKHVHLDQVDNRAGKFWYGALFGA